MTASERLEIAFYIFVGVKIVRSLIVSWWQMKSVKEIETRRARGAK
jgi:hypothetical protein